MKSRSQGKEKGRERREAGAYYVLCSGNDEVLRVHTCNNKDNPAYLPISPLPSFASCSSLYYSSSPMLMVILDLFLFIVCSDKKKRGK